MRITEKQSRNFSVVGVCLALLCLIGCGGSKHWSGSRSDINYMQATETPESTPRVNEGRPAVVYPETGRTGNPNAETVRGPARPRLTPIQQMAANLNQEKQELQQRADRLGVELRTARGSRARKITKELDEIARQMGVVDKKLASIPQSALEDPIPSREPRPVLPVIEEGPVDIPVTPEAPAELQTVYRVQIAVLSDSNPGAFSDLGRDQILEVRRADGRYGYYYGSFPTQAAAEAAGSRIRSSSKYRDAFVVRMRGNERL